MDFSNSILKSFRNSHELNLLDKDNKIKDIYLKECDLKSTKYQKEITPQKIYWDEKHYGVGLLKKYQSLSQNEKISLLEHMNEFNIHEACLVENLGFRFNSKMMLMAKTVDEKSMYAQFAYDEAVHLNSLLPYAKLFGPMNIDSQPLIQYLSKAIDNAGYSSTVYLIQIVLEGFTLSHYKKLAESCLSEGLKEVLCNILKDEAFHHAGGKAIYKENPHKKEEIQEMVELVSKLSRIFINWAHPILRAFSLIGYDSEEFQKELLNELNIKEKSKLRIEGLKGLLDQLPNDFLNDLNDGKAFIVHDENEVLKDYKTSFINPKNAKNPPLG